MAAFRWMFLCMTFLYPVHSNAVGNTYFTIKARLDARLDSLQVAKQALKRQGKPIAGLEKQSRLLKDSIGRIRNRIEQSGSEGANVHDAAAGGEHANPLFGKPDGLSNSTFQILIAAAAAVAAVILSLLVFRILRAFSRSRSSRPAAKPVSLPPESSPRPSRPGPVSRIPEMTLPPAVNEDPAKRKISDIRSRITRSMPAAVSPNPRGTPQGPAEQSTRPEQTIEPGDRRDAIVDAARKGMTIAQISRQYHIGADQVSLILTVAGIKPSR